MTVRSSRVKLWSIKPSMTGESLPVQKSVGSYVYAGTVAEEGECVICRRKSYGRRPL